VVVEFNGKKVADSRHLKLEVARVEPGESVPMKVLRDGSTKTLNVTVKAAPTARTWPKPARTGTMRTMGL